MYMYMYPICAEYVHTRRMSLYDLDIIICAFVFWLCRLWLCFSDIIAKGTSASASVHKLICLWTAQRLECYHWSRACITIHPEALGRSLVQASILLLRIYCSQNFGPIAGGPGLVF